MSRKLQRFGAVAAAFAASLLLIAEPALAEDGDGPEEPPKRLTVEEAEACAAEAAELLALRRNFESRAAEIEASAAAYEEKKAEFERYPENRRTARQLEDMLARYNERVNAFNADQEDFTKRAEAYNDDCSAKRIDWEDFSTVCAPYTDSGNLFCEAYGGFWDDLVAGRDPRAEE